jgi:hypothetical protein
VNAFRACVRCAHRHYVRPRCAQAIWIYTCFIHRFTMERIKDYFMMYFHHLLTIGLLGALTLPRVPVVCFPLRFTSGDVPIRYVCAAGSYYVNYLKIGLLVLLIHDASDIGVDTLKIVNYTKLRDRKGWFGAEVCGRAAFSCCCCCVCCTVVMVTWRAHMDDGVCACAYQTAFTVNLISWFYFRVYVYPMHVIYSAFACSFGIVSADDTPASVDGAARARCAPRMRPSILHASRRVVLDVAPPLLRICVSPVTCVYACAAILPARVQFREPHLPREQWIWGAWRLFFSRDSVNTPEMPLWLGCNVRVHVPWFARAAARRLTCARNCVAGHADATVRIAHSMDVPVPPDLVPHPDKECG